MDNYPANTWVSMATVAALAVALALPVAVAAKGDPANALASHKLTRLDGSASNLSQYRGEVVVVNFWASWCAPCRKELPIMNRWNDTWQRNGARVIAISVDSEAAKAKRFVEKAGLTMDVFHDGPGGLAQTLDLPSLPCTYLLDRSGRVLRVLQSSNPEDLASLERQVNTMLTEAPRSPRVQRAGMANELDGKTPNGGE